MSMKVHRQWQMMKRIDAAAKERAAAVEAGIDVEAEDYGKPRNRAERRWKVRSLPRQFRISVHQRGQWMKKVVKDGRLERP